mmetsp:Transcript_18239/g.32685  ORF Transcript_18239/g.32685 Transcript_18239/m.32685 type:complete len:220 (-) Transcript_18239:481-1140(-)
MASAASAAEEQRPPRVFRAAGVVVVVAGACRGRCGFCCGVFCGCGCGCFAGCCSSCCRCGNGGCSGKRLDMVHAKGFEGLQVASRPRKRPFEVVDENGVVAHDRRKQHPDQRRAQALIITVKIDLLGHNPVLGKRPPAQHEVAASLREAIHAILHHLLCPAARSTARPDPARVDAYACVPDVVQHPQEEPVSASAGFAAAAAAAAIATTFAMTGPLLAE